MQKNIKNIAIPVAALSLLLVMVVWLAGGFADKVSPSDMNVVKIDSNKEYPTHFLVKKIKSTTYEPISAEVTAKEATIISSRTIARIDEITVRAGDVVQKGQLLVSLEQKDVQAQVSQADQQVKALAVRLQEANKNLQRSIDLREQKLVSEFVVDKEQANVDALSAELIAAEQALSHAKTVLAYNALTSPISGIVIDRFAEPGDTAQPGNKLLSLYNPNSLRISAQVRESLAIKLAVGQQVQVEIPSTKQSVSGTVAEIVPAANTGSRSFLVFVSVEQSLISSAQVKLLPGMYAKLILPTGEHEAFSIPADKVSRVGQLTLVWVLENGVKQRRFVRIDTDKSFEGMVNVMSGLRAGDKIVDPDV